MSLGTALLLLACFWCLVHFVHRLLSGPQAHLPSAILPTTSHHTTNGPTRIFRFGPSSHRPHSHQHSQTTLTLSFLHLRLSTTRWNAAHDQLASFLARRANQRLSALVRGVYDLGVAFGALGMLIACLGLGWACWGALARFVGGLETHVERVGMEGVAGLMRRSTTDDAPAKLRPDAPGAASSWGRITPIIPGVTVPLSHLPLILLGVFLSQAFHELGHALAGACESLPLLSAGASLTLFLPSAFVSFPSPSSSASTLPARAHARLIAAGPFHNILLWGFLFLCAHSGVLTLIGRVSGYKSASGLGKVVVSVAPDSPLFLHLPPGSIITALDDTPLALGTSSQHEDKWTEYLTAPRPTKPTLGWCVGRHTLRKSDECCRPPTTNATSPFVCFASVATDSSHSEFEPVRGCIDPVPVLTSPVSALNLKSSISKSDSHSNSNAKEHNRCASSDDCAPESACVLPEAGAQLMRVTVRPAAWAWASSSSTDDEDEEGREAVVLWSGPRAEVWEEVQVSNWLPRAWYLPLWAPPLLEQFWDYLLMAALSLYFFNLLPLPHLDGTELLRAFLDIALDEKGQGFMFDLESLEGGADERDNYESTRRRRRWKERVVRAANYGVGGALGCYVLLGVMNGFG